jgi:hypothetical protein
MESEDDFQQKRWAVYARKRPTTQPWNLRWNNRAAAATAEKRKAIKESRQLNITLQCSL